MTEFWNKRREKLQKDVVNAALELCDHTGVAAFKLPLDDDTDDLFIIVGNSADLEKFIK